MMIKYRVSKAETLGRMVMVNLEWLRLSVKRLNSTFTSAQGEENAG